MKLIDAARLAKWQTGIANFQLQETTQINETINDYLRCYGLDNCAFHKEVNYFLGFRTIEGFQILHQYFQQKQTDAETVLIVHGFTDHAGLFTKVIKDLLNKGKSVVVFDLPGHGLSSGERASIDTFDTYQKVFTHCLSYFQTALKQPLHLLGQSMGGAIVMQYLLTHRGNEQGLRKVILFAPLVRPAAWRQALWSYRFLSKVVSSIPRSYSENSEDKQFLHFVRYEDPVQHDRLSTQWVGAMLEWAQVFETFELSNFPLWIIQGDKDETVDWQFNMKRIQEKFPHVNIRYVEGAGHHLAGESDRLQAKVFAFIDEALASATA